MELVSLKDTLNVSKNKIIPLVVLNIDQINQLKMMKDGFWFVYMNDGEIYKITEKEKDKISKIIEGIPWAEKIQAVTKKVSKTNKF